MSLTLKKGAWDAKKVKTRWDLLTIEQIEGMKGDKDKLIEAVRDAYDHDRIQAIVEVETWLPQLMKD